MPKPRSPLSLSDVGDGGRAGERPTVVWTAVAASALPVAVASVLFFGALTAVAGCQLLGDGIQLCGEFGRGRAGMRALTPAEAAAALAESPELTPAQAATFGARLRSPGQDWVDTTGPVPSGRELYVWVEKQTGATHVQSRLPPYLKHNLTLAADGRVVAEDWELPPDDWLDEHRLGRPACLVAGLSMAVTSAVNVVVGGWLLAIAVTILGRRPTARSRARRWAIIQLATAVAGAAAIAWANYADELADLADDPRANSISAVVAAAGVLPAAVLLLLACGGRNPDSVTSAAAGPV